MTMKTSRIYSSAASSLKVLGRGGHALGVALGSRGSGLRE
jgi:hypothetical protein